ncbi:hypothetical protein [Alkalinema sp. FACHB-956]|uniref:hypothetical protein n=1 Tax=Alkalinema sp. FACHB-956 TaxID=2692768 RepID=UPI001683A11A|nr:hypothetical protein [Alkalinema sp. FACHB-956]MBD2328554.1 hypothetical protein [Alkalinema sp. FACHB-956]
MVGGVGRGQETQQELPFKFDLARWHTQLVYTVGIHNTIGDRLFFTDTGPPAAIACCILKQASNFQEKAVKKLLGAVPADRAIG